MKMRLFSLAQLSQTANYLSSLVAKSTVYRHLFFALAAFSVILVTGYYFGTFDQISHIPFLKKEIDPSLYPNDAFVELRHTHYSYFWYLFYPFARAGALEITLFIAHFLSIYLSFWFLYRLSALLFKDKLVSFLSVLVFVVPHIGFSAFPVFEFSLLNRTMVFPFLLLAIELYLRRMLVWAFLLLGVLYNFHVISVNFVGAMFLADILLSFRKLPKKQVFLLPFVFLLAAYPVLSWKFGRSPVDFSLRPEYFDLLTRTTLEHIFLPFSSWYSLIVTASGLSSFGLFYIARRAKGLSPHTKTVTNFLLVILFLFFVQVAVAYFLPVTIIIQSQIIRGGIFALVFGYLFFTAFSLDLLKRSRLSSREFWVVLFSAMFSITPMVPLFVWAARRFLTGKIWIYTSVFVVMSSAIAIMYLMVKLSLWMPGIHIYPEKTDWYLAQVWAKESTQKDAVFLTPVHEWWLYTPEWRVFSERSQVTALSESLEWAFTPEYIPYWQERFGDVAPGAVSKFRGDVFENRELARDAFYGLSQEEILRVAKKYGAEYIVYEKPMTLRLPVVYENENYTIYALQ